MDLKPTVCCSPKDNLVIQQEFTTININGSQKLTNVQGFSARDHQIHFLPKNIKAFFPKLEVLELFKTGLKKISSRDMKNLENLKYLSLSHNKIEVLEANLFQYNRGLKTVILNNNKISLIEPTAFKGLVDLKHLQLQNNHCINKAESNFMDVENLIESSKIICSKIVVELQHKILKIDEKFTKIIEETQNMPNESENSNIWSKMKEWFKSYMSMNNNNNNAATKKEENIKIISTRNDETLNRSFIEMSNNDTLDMIINSVFDSTNMTDIRMDMTKLKQIITLSHESRTKFRHLISILIVLALLSYSCNFFIMYYLYPKTDELWLTNQKGDMSAANIYDDVPVRYVPSLVS